MKQERVAVIAGWAGVVQDSYHYRRVGRVWLALADCVCVFCADLILLDAVIARRCCCGRVVCCAGHKRRRKRRNDVMAAEHVPADQTAKQPTAGRQKVYTPPRLRFDSFTSSSFQSDRKH